ncbi:PREDICTED: ubiquitin-like protein FUBI [Amphimedon queenslandica]|uniref:Ubiquitin-like domain-containing protein n=2 Tax=Amphimedon queenslandica TaxID=400682 RepID=A0A1X7VEE0_AMPQE|nr:PREDICTED: ubiquitin-like protein FUBI [Amphimedon queenslandica]|eukprot:XP_003384744.1 PREDICTED: ubiquitin-like protein FUBI [Amphimedon queenslandica]
MQIFIQGQQVHTVTDTECQTVQELKLLLSEVEGIPVEDQIVSFGGVPLDDELCLFETIPSLATLSLTARMVGGKVHGSLARAGKVRGQTPKVEAQEKKKKKTGRAKRRMQYNRRFVNVVASFGRKKGPNSNAP